MHARTVFSGQLLSPWSQFSKKEGKIAYFNSLQRDSRTITYRAEILWSLEDDCYACNVVAKTKQQSFHQGRMRTVQQLCLQGCPTCLSPPEWVSVCCFPRVHARQNRCSYFIYELQPLLLGARTTEMYIYGSL